MSDCSSGDEYEESPSGDFFPPCQDLYSEKIHESASACWTHAKEKYGIDIQVLCKKHSLDPFSYIRLVNYIRSEKPNPKDLMNAPTDEPWRDVDAWMSPTLPNDALLMYDVTEQEEIEEEQDKDQKLSLKGENVSIPYEEFRLLTKFREEFQPLLESYREQTERMTSITQRLVQDTSLPSSAPSVVGRKGEEEKQEEDIKLSQSVSALVLENEDQGYAGSYSHFGIHHEMLSDEVRTNSYREAIERNAKSLIHSKDILDLGCGTGILSLFSARSGAKSVTAVDMSDVLSHAIDIAHENGLQDIISFRKGRLENIPDINQKFDVIVSEWMGYFLLFEGMLDSVLDARNKYLSPGGRLLPNRCSLLLAAVSDMDRYSKTVGFWKDVYGFKMSCMREPVLEEASIEIVPSKCIISESPAEILDLDLEHCSLQDYSSFSSDFQFKMVADGKLTAICGYFDTHFELPEKAVSFTTGPHGLPTHWKQTLFYLKEPLPVKQGDLIKGSISVKRPRRDPRSLVVKLKVQDTEQKFLVD